MREMITQIVDQLGDAFLIVAALTGQAAINVNGQTIHTALSIPVLKTGERQIKVLEGDVKNEFMRRMASVRFLLVDEMSMIGQSLLSQFSFRCREAAAFHRPSLAALPFGGYFVWLFGDFGQLPPVMDLPLYSTASSNSSSPPRASASFQRVPASLLPTSASGSSGSSGSLGPLSTPRRSARRSTPGTSGSHSTTAADAAAPLSSLAPFSAFKRIISLTTCHRQHGDAAAPFRTLLNNMYEGKLSKKDYGLLNSRRRAVLNNFQKSFFIMHCTSLAPMSRRMSTIFAICIPPVFQLLV